MKKKLVVLLAVVMMFAFSASAYAASFSDVSDRPIVEQDAIKKAVALGIIEGYEDGTFGPDKTITRAEFAKIAVTAAGAKETATMLEANASSFKDVRANSWYTGWINAAESLGIFKGDQNGNFRPNDTISNQEAITVLLRLLGYNDNLTGSWPVNYVTKANQIGILDDVNIVASAAAKRGDIVVMLSETLDTSIVTYDKDTNEFVYKQTTKSGSSYITLLDDSFEGNFLSVNKFNKIEQVRDVANKTLNWNVGDVVTTTTITDSMNNTKVTEKSEPYGKTLIVDENTAVSYNATGLFDLENHQGKVYYITGNDGKLYARFIEVESYTQRVSDKPVPDGTKVKVNTTNYNAVTGVKAAQIDSKNTGYYMYFNDDDQVYRIASDREFVERSYYVKSLTTSSARLIGNDAEGTNTKTVNMSDADTLIYDDGKFISPSDLEVGDAIMEIREGELYAKVDDASGDFTRVTRTGSATLYQHKAMLGGTNYVYKNTTEDLQGDKAPSPLFYEENLDDAGISVDDVYDNNVRYLLNKDNSISAVIVDETSTGATLYGIVTDGGGSGGTWAKNMNSITLFTQEGYTVTYDFDKNCVGKPADDEGYMYMGRLVSYKLNANGDIKNFYLIQTYGVSEPSKTDTDAHAAWEAAKDKRAGYSFADGEIEVKNNAYLVDVAGKQASLAANVVIFEVGKDGTDVDPILVTRSSLLSGGDFEPEALTGVNIYDGNGRSTIDAYAVYDTNSNGAIKALAYTNASSKDYHYGVVKAWRFTDADHAGGSAKDYAVTLVGDDTVYDLSTGTAADAAKADQFIIFTLSGDTLSVVKAFGNDAGLKNYAQDVTGFNDGLISVANGWTSSNAATETTIIDQYKTSSTVTSSPRNGQTVYNIMTDSNTVVYVLDSNSGDYKEGSLSDISRNSCVYIPVVDKDGYADVVLVDEYPHPVKNNQNTSEGGVERGNALFTIAGISNGYAGDINLTNETSTSCTAELAMYSDVKSQYTDKDYAGIRRITWTVKESYTDAAGEKVTNTIYGYSGQGTDTITFTKVKDRSYTVSVVVSLE